MKLMPVGVGGAKNISPSKGAAAIVKTVPAAGMKPYLTNKSGKRHMNLSLKSPQNFKINKLMPFSIALTHFRSRAT